MLRPVDLQAETPAPQGGASPTAIPGFDWGDVDPPICNLIIRNNHEWRRRCDEDAHENYHASANEPSRWAIAHVTPPGLSNVEYKLRGKLARIVRKHEP